MSQSDIRINEVSPINGVYQDLFGNTGPWIELYNAGDARLRSNGLLHQQ